MDYILAFSLLSSAVASLPHMPPILPGQIVLTPGPDLLSNSPNFCDDLHHCPANEKCCDAACIPYLHDCCSASTHCLPGDYCFLYDNEPRCCPEGLSCIHASGEFIFTQTVQWYEDLSDEGYEDWYQSVIDVTSIITVAASYAGEASAAYASMSRAITDAAHMLPTKTITEGRAPTA
ncbi:uncharacterized protein BDV17DRAFT_252140 [Aspergillus undulatus]|uniref:uncharacterized protein n=1 Tax=Aspergillus undulatus TaxID=1810928 RepID=UPI003CCC8F84